MTRFIILICFILIGAWYTSAAPAASKNIQASPKSVKSRPSKDVTSAHPSGYRRGKRNVITSLNDEDEKELMNEIASLSDDELRLLKTLIVSKEFNNPALEIPEDVEDDEVYFIPQSQDELYEVIEVPDDAINEPMILPRDRRALFEDEMKESGDDDVPIIIEEVVPLDEQVEDDYETPLVIPEPVLEKLIEEDMEDMELESRIREMANILNERISRD
ncbi:unnamed protein product [Auanema sp. JU1783]|nr:unnamed protein product [Auanema sp. JU1783]